MTASPENSEPLAESLQEQLAHLARRIRDTLGGSPPPLLAEIRQMFLDAHEEAEASALERTAAALRRLASLIELWECFGDAGDGAAEIGQFCALGVEQLGAPMVEQAETAAASILEESSRRWGEYLELLEPRPGDVEESPSALDDSPLEEEAEPAIDTAALLRLFTGSGIGEAEAADPSPTASPSTGFAGSAPQRPPQPSGKPAEPQGRESPCQRPGQPDPTVLLRPFRSLGNGDPPPSKSLPALTVPPLPSPSALDPEIRDAFLADASELFERIEPVVLGLGRAGNDAEALHQLGRCFHTLKGAAGSVGLGDLAQYVHGLEEYLEAAEAPATPDLIDLLLEAVGHLERLLDHLRKGGEEAPAAAKDAEPNQGPALAGGPTVYQPEPAAVGLEPKAAREPAAPAAAASSGAAEMIRISASRFDVLMDLVSELIARKRLWTAQAESMKSIATMLRSCRGRMLSSLDRLHEAGLGRPGGGLRLDPRHDLPGQLRRLQEQADDLAVLAETAQAATGPLADHGDALGHLTLQLWDELQAVRIVPIKGLFQRLVRVAHDAAKVEGRRVEVEMIGEETGVDRAVQDKAFEPLLHVVRNAVGHGIEPPEDRQRAGKPATGRITLEARREGNTLRISVADDGRGLNHEAIAAKARKLGLLEPGETPSLERLNHLIFHPGFSTRSSANEISGRGVGMDVVAREVGQLKGTIQLQTAAGQGTRLTIRLPARLALETAMIVRVGRQAFAVAVVQIEQVGSSEPEPGAAGAAKSGGVPGDRPTATVNFRDRSIPLVHAREMLGISHTPAPAWPKLLIVRAAGGLIALAVDSIEGTEDLVIKPLGALLAGHPLIAGTSQSASGEIISILNPSGMERWIADGLSPAPLGLGARPLQEHPCRGASVLVVDDSISVRRVVARQLRALGLEVDEVSDGLEALGRLRGGSYRLVVTDLEMPRLDGFALVAEMRRLGALADVPVIVASTKADPETQQRVLALGARAFLAKPVDPVALARAVGPLLSAATV